MRAGVGVQVPLIILVDPRHDGTTRGDVRGAASLAWVRVRVRVRVRVG